MVCVSISMQMSVLCTHVSLSMSSKHLVRLSSTKNKMEFTGCAVAPKPIVKLSLIKLICHQA